LDHAHGSDKESPPSREAGATGTEAPGWTISATAGVPEYEITETSITGSQYLPQRWRFLHRSPHLPGTRHKYHPRSINESIVVQRTIVVCAIVLVLSLGIGVAIGLKTGDQLPSVNHFTMEPVTEEGRAAGQGPLSPPEARSATPVKDAPTIAPAVASATAAENASAALATDGSATPACSRSLFGCEAQPNLPSIAPAVASATAAENASAALATDGSATPACSRSLFGCEAQPNLPIPAELSGTATPTG
jgi:hypothetical protein